jgi:hypothetical protein
MEAEYEPSAEWLARFKDDPESLAIAIGTLWESLVDAFYEHSDWLTCTGLSKPACPRLSSLSRLLVLWLDTENLGIDATPIQTIARSLYAYHKKEFGSIKPHTGPPADELERQMTQAVRTLERMDTVARTRFRRRGGPEWNRDQGELRLNGHLVKRVRNTSTAEYIEILDTFHRDNWPLVIDWPYPISENPKRPYDLLRSLNANCKGLRFFFDGSGLHRVKWRRT